MINITIITEIHEYTLEEKIIDMDPELCLGPLPLLQSLPVPPGPGEPPLGPWQVSWPATRTD